MEVIPLDCAYVSVARVSSNFLVKYACKPNKGAVP
jgi:hypothetical protein